MALRTLSLGVFLLTTLAFFVAAVDFFRRLPLLRFLFLLEVVDCLRFLTLLVGLLLVVVDDDDVNNGGRHSFL